MGLLNTLTFDGVLSSDYGVYIAGDGAFNSPERRGEMVNIPGRNGSLFLDGGAFENISVEYPAFIGTGSEVDFRTKLAELRSEMKSRTTYKRLTDTYHPDEFRLALYQSGIEVEPQACDRAGGFTLIFNCKPQRYLTSGEIPVIFTGNGSIVNPTTFESSPIIQVTGDGTVAIGPYRFTVSGNPGTITIDTELMEVYIPAGEPYELTDENGDPVTDELNTILEAYNGLDQNTSMMSYVSFQDSLMPKIPVGEVNIGMQNTITELVIIPRWWRI